MPDTARLVPGEPYIARGRWRFHIDSGGKHGDDGDQPDCIRARKVEIAPYLNISQANGSARRLSFTPSVRNLLYVVSAVRHRLSGRLLTWFFAVLLGRVARETP